MNNVYFGSPKTNPSSGREEDSNPGRPDYKSNYLPLGHASTFRDLMIEKFMWDKGTANKIEENDNSNSKTTIEAQWKPFFLHVLIFYINLCYYVTFLILRSLLFKRDKLLTNVKPLDFFLACLTEINKVFAANNI